MYPPSLSESQGLWLASQIQDWELNHGTMLKRIHTQTAHNVLCYPVAATMFPTLFPRVQFDRARELQSIYNELYCVLATEEQWIYDNIKDLFPVDPFAAALWEIHEKVKANGGYVQDISAGIFRSDYMLQGEGVEMGGDESFDPRSDLELKQVEFNTIACAGGCHANKVVDMHRHLARTGAYNSLTDDNLINLPVLPPNNNIHSLATSLAQAHEVYGPPKSNTTETAILFVVQPNNFNVADERPIEYALWDSNIPAYRVEWGNDVLKHTSLSATKELLFHPPWQTSAKPVEISVIYYRAGHEPHEYDQTGQDLRFRLEQSRAIKCPSILAHILTFKKIQQSLAVPGVVEQFLPADKVAAVRKTFVPMYPLDTSETGLHARSLATDPDRSENYILKPSLEGGGHNVFGADIPAFLATVPPEAWSAYVLMQRIASPLVGNMLKSSQGIEEAAAVVSELGVFGACLWRCTRAGEGEVLRNETVGWSLKTKFADVDEMSVVKGFGCFDTPLLC
ncbi:glutathione synthase [Aspergillus heteromorphus CBS 117.55]|uniref:Glutathione synthetase n=1 Tax=Aspergillus heteromorphus CBS 117.55 TaxID=1448321 RepID=A0A317WW34_9EURO|nr:glutathione synthase [Aspergillus heteromorphus CBS 117.55]PWY90091.1 glutathione synthase [Aspergillus heteromorphus CBS 117.55]